MGYQTNGIEGIVTSWDGTANTHLIATGMRVRAANLTETGGELDVTGFAAALTSRRFRSALKGWSVTIEGMCPNAAPDIGRAGNVTFASGYAAFVRSWNMTITSDVQDITSINGTAIVWRRNRPALLSGSGSYTCLVDSAVATTLSTSPAAASAAATFQTQASNTIGGNIIITSVSAPIAVGEQNLLTFNYRFDGGITVAGSAGILPAGLIGLPEWDATGDGVPDRVLEFQSDAGHVYAGPAFWSSIAIDCSYDGLITASVTATGADELEVNPA